MRWVTLSPELYIFCWDALLFPLGENNELDDLSAFSEIVPDTVFFSMTLRGKLHLYFMKL